MLQKKDSPFRFHKNDSIGASGAEEDLKFLSECFVDTGDMESLENIEDRKQIVVGRTGAGKSALLHRLAERKGPQAIQIDPEALALTYISNSTILRFFEDLGVNLSPFFKLLWRHVLVVEVLDAHFSLKSESDQEGLLDKIKIAILGDTRAQKEAKETLAYLETWGKRFWLETEFRVKEITKKLEGQLGSELDAHLGTSAAGLSAKLNTAASLSKEERQELHNRGQKIVHDAQVADLAKVISMLDRVLTNKQRGYYILIDRLDEDWVADQLKTKLIMALLQTAREFLRIGSAKMIIAMRIDLLDRVFRDTRSLGQQEEKYQSLYLRIVWSKDDILKVLDKRVQALVSRRYTKQKVSYKELLPKKYDGNPIGEYIFSIAPRPRDVIDLFNCCILTAANKTRLSADNFKVVLGEYSRSRLRALGAEWSARYPCLLDFALLVSRRPTSFKTGAISEQDLENCCLEVAARSDGPVGHLEKIAIDYVEGKIVAGSVRASIVSTLYKVGLIGLKLQPHEKGMWSDERGRVVSTPEIHDDVSILAHPMYQRALGIGDRSRG